MNATVTTFGCRLNLAEGEAIRAMLGQRDIAVVNTCAVTADAVAGGRKAIRRAARLRPDRPIVATGCAAQIDAPAFAAMPEVARVLGQHEKRDPAAYADLKAGAREVRVADVMRVHRTAPHLAHAFAEHARAFVEVQNGCDHRCTFCVIPHGRGPSRSLPIDAVVERIAGLVAHGMREVVLTGVDLTSWGHDLPGGRTLGDLVGAILARTSVARLRLSSLDGPEIDPTLFALVTQERRVMPHLHLSLQAGDDLILKRMRRRHARADAVRLVDRLKTARPELAIGADLIAGFPTEDDAAAARTLALVTDCDIVFGHIFPYSPRPATPAARMPQVPREVIRARAAALRAASAARKAQWLGTLVGSVRTMLVERDGRTGHDESFAGIASAAPLPPGSIARIRVSSHDGVTLHGEPA